MGVIKQFADGLVNVVANLGTARDKASHSRNELTAFGPDYLLTTYRSSWLAAAIVDYPAEDATRKWRAWRAEAPQISKIEALEAKLGVQNKVKEALIAARLYGGAAIYINTQSNGQSSPLTVGEEIKSLVVLDSNVLKAEEAVKDINNDYYGKPEFYTLTTGSDARQVRIHASRLVIFIPKKLPNANGVSVIQNQGWGDSVLQSTYAAIMQADGTMANIASLVYEAKINVYKFKGFADILSQAGGDAKVSGRLNSQTAMKGINGDVVIDSEDSFEQRNTSFSGLDSIATKFEIAVSGASKIPVTRLYGRASAGLSGSGDGDERVYYDRIGHMQGTDLTPALSLLDDCLIYQALGSRPPEIYTQWRPLRQLTESERAEIFSKTATAARTLAGTQVSEIIPLDALSESLTNELIEQGMLPGLEQAIEKYGSLYEQRGGDE